MNEKKRGSRTPTVALRVKDPWLVTESRADTSHSWWFRTSNLALKLPENKPAIGRLLGLNDPDVVAL